MATTTLLNTEAVGGLSLELLAKQLVEGFITGLHKSPYHGFSVEFAEHRLYNEGQSTRHIDWKVFARTDKLFTKQYEEETNLRCLVAIDTSSSMYYPAANRGKLRWSIYAAAALAHLLQRQRDAVGTCFFHEWIEAYSPMKSTRAHLQKLYIQFEQLLRADPEKQKTSRVASAIHEIAEKTHKRSLVVLFSDMFDSAEDSDEIFKALQHLKHNRHEVLLFHVSDQATELQFEFADRPHEFIDLETNEKLKLNPQEIRARFTEQQQLWNQTLRLRCNQLKIDFISVNTTTPVQEVLQAYLIKRLKMR
jgi:uncharacterized protein (DUF58 family)